MASSGNSRGGLLTAGGVLSMIGGIVELIGGVVILVVVRHIMTGGPLRTVPHIPWMPGLEIQLVFFPTRVLIAGIVITVLGAIGVVGSMSALSRKSFGLSLAGAICVLPTVIFGIPAVVFVALSKREFTVEIKEDGIPSRRWLPIAGGILSIIGGVIDLVGIGMWYETLYYLRVHPVIIGPFAVLIPLMFFGFFLTSIIGGLSAINRKSYRGSIAGAICALPSIIFGILALIFIVLGKREFEVED